MLDLKLAEKRNYIPPFLPFKLMPFLRTHSSADGLLDTRYDTTIRVIWIDWTITLDYPATSHLTWTRHDLRIRFFIFSSLHILTLTKFSISSFTSCEIIFACRYEFRGQRKNMLEKRKYITIYNFLCAVCIVFFSLVGVSICYRFKGEYRRQDSHVYLCRIRCRKMCVY